MYDNLRIQSTLSKTDTFETGTKCPSYRDVRLIKSQIKGINKGNSRCPFYRGVRFIEGSVKRESTVLLPPALAILSNTGKQKCLS